MLGTNPVVCSRPLEQSGEGKANLVGGGETKNGQGAGADDGDYATAHKIKVLALTRMSERPTSPAQIAREIGEGMSASNVSYHVRTLLKADLVELVDERPVRGATEHLYRTVKLSSLSDEEFAELSEEEKRAWVETAIGLYGADAMQSLETKTLLQHDDFQMFRTALKVDGEGWDAIREVYIAAQKQVEVIKAESELRIAESDGPSMPILSFLGLFEMTPTQA